MLLSRLRAAGSTARDKALGKNKAVCDRVSAPYPEKYIKMAA